MFVSILGSPALDDLASIFAAVLKSYTDSIPTCLQYVMFATRISGPTVLLIASVTRQTMGFYPIEPSEMSGETPKQPQLGDDKWKRLAACPPD